MLNTTKRANKGYNKVREIYEDLSKEEKKRENFVANDIKISEYE